MPNIPMHFRFEDHNIRILTDIEEQPWWVAQDVCAIFGLTDVSQAISRLKSDEKRVMGTDIELSVRNTETIDNKGVTSAKSRVGSPPLLIINEKGLYRLIFRSNKPEAARFQDWVFGEVLPTLRKTGKYETSPTIPPAPDPALFPFYYQSPPRPDRTKSDAYNASTVYQWLDHPETAKRIHVNFLRRWIETQYRIAAPQKTLV